MRLAKQYSFRKAMFFLICMVFFQNMYAKNIEIWHYWKGNQEKILMEMVQRYQIENPNIKINLKKQNFWALNGKYMVISEYGSGPDILLGPSDWIGKFVKAGFLEPLDKHIEEKSTEKYMSKVIDACKYTDKIFGLPINYVVVMMVYNKDLLEIPADNTDDLIKQIKNIINKDQGVYGLVYDVSNYYYQMIWITGFGGRILNEENNPEFKSQAHVRALKFVSKLHFEDNIIPRNISYDTAMDLFTNNKAALGIFHSGELEKIYNSGVNFGIIKLPIMSDTGILAKPLIGPEIFMVSKASDHKKEAVKLIEYFCSEKVQEELISHSDMIPTIEDIYNGRKLKKSKYFEYILKLKEQANNSIPMPNSPEMLLALWPVGNMMMDKILSGGYSVEEAVDAAKIESKQALEEYNK